MGPFIGLYLGPYWASGAVTVQVQLHGRSAIWWMFWENAFHTCVTATHDLDDERKLWDDEEAPVY